MAEKRAITVLGATGTIGQNTLDVVRNNSDKFSIFALCADSNYKKLIIDCIEFEPKFAVLNDPDSYGMLKSLVKDAGLKTKVILGQDATCDVACNPDVDYVMAAVVGSAGLNPVIAAAKSGKRIMLANKETLVMAGNLFMQAVRQGGAELLPIDSEHNAIFQVMPKSHNHEALAKGINKVILTASGGPFRQLPLEQMKNVTVKQALQHPNWVMGKKITIDSATMMNKGLEVIEAHWLFGASADQIDVVIHPQSVIHSMVEYEDGSTLAQMGNPDMRVPIAYALAYPERMKSGVNAINFSQISKLEFEAPDLSRFPCLQIAYDALRLGGTAPAIINAANEIAVKKFLEESIRFSDIPQLIEDVLNMSSICPLESIQQLLVVDQEARLLANNWESKE